MNNSNLSSGLEDYIEAIYIADINKTQLKGAELARHLNISRASVSEALMKLVSKGLVEYKSYGSINLTEKGRAEAIRIYHRHNVLKEFFEKILGINSDEAEEIGCKIEHIVSKNILEKIRQFTLICEKHPQILEEYRKFNE
jgi:DtxR family Mn-dependent transcriptional regulator